MLISHLIFIQTAVLQYKKAHIYALLSNFTTNLLDEWFEGDRDRMLAILDRVKLQFGENVPIRNVIEAAGRGDVFSGFVETLDTASLPESDEVPLEDADSTFMDRMQNVVPDFEEGFDLAWGELFEFFDISDDDEEDDDDLDAVDEEI